MNETLRASDLMVGDYVKWEYVSYPAVVFNNGYKKVDAIYGDESVDLIDEDTHYEHVPMDEIKSVELTAEILEKNGFVKMDGDHYRYFLAYDDNYYAGFESVNYYTDACFCNVTKECSDGTQEQSKGVYKYVHQLQHALRLCGIKQEITI